MNTIVDSSPVIPLCSGGFFLIDFLHLLIDEGSILANICPDCELPTDIALKSSDGTLFGAHRAELANYAGFMPMDMPRTEGDSDIVEMPAQYSSTTLKYMLAYMHPNHPSPDIRALTVLDIESLARAVQLHEIYRGIEICKSQMQFFVESDPLVVFRYAAEHRDRYLLKKAVPYTIDETFGTMKQNIINLAILAAWAEYREEFINCSKNLMAPATPESSHTNKDVRCRSWDEFYKDVQHEFLGKPLSAFSQIRSIIVKHISTLHGCKQCVARALKLVPRLTPDTTNLLTIFDTLQL
ncbi:hypothetical protein H0H92_011803 [Tricholoma furcatifolium]|nr:hypothetical protein H0H92_011803 [Tricholoma furcatifolium]